MLRKTIQAFTLFALLSTPIASFSSEASVITGQKAISTTSSRLKA